MLLSIFNYTIPLSLNIFPDNMRMIATKMRPYRLSRYVEPNQLFLVEIRL